MKRRSAGSTTKTPWAPTSCPRAFGSSTWTAASSRRSPPPSSPKRARLRAAVASSRGGELARARLKARREHEVALHAGRRLRVEPAREPDAKLCVVVVDEREVHAELAADTDVIRRPRVA